MSKEFNAENLIKSILAARSKESVMDAIERGTQGKSLPDATLTAIHDGLMKHVQSDKAEVVVAQIMAVLKAAGGLTSIKEKAEDLFATTRKGTKYNAIRAGITAYNQGLGDNEISEAMAAKCPAISDAAKAEARLISLLNQAMALAPEAGHKKMTKALDKLLSKIQ